MIDTLQNIQDSIQNSTQSGFIEVHQQNADGFNWWILIAAIELILLIVLLIKLKKAEKNGQLQSDGYGELLKAKGQDIDMTNLMNSINSSRDVYKELSHKCHPDRFQDEIMKMKAENIFQEISKYKRNHAKLMELKKRAQEELNVKF